MPTSPPLALPKSMIRIPLHLSPLRHLRNSDVSIKQEPFSKIAVNDSTINTEIFLIPHHQKRRKDDVRCCDTTKTHNLDFLRLLFKPKFNFGQTAPRSKKSSKDRKDILFLVSWSYSSIFQPSPFETTIEFHRTYRNRTYVRIIDARRASALKTTLVP